MADRTCTVCDARFEAQQPNKIYCSPKCKNTAGARLRRVRNASRTHRNCYRCAQTKPAAEFISPWHTYCGDCHKAYNRDWEPSAASRARRRQRKRENEPYDRGTRVQYLYGISPEKYAGLLAAQDGRCAICRDADPGGRWNTWHVDHDHGHCSGKRACETCVRGILCNRCNLALGYLRDDPVLIAAALRYVTRETE